MPRIWKTSVPEDRLEVLDRPFVDLLEDSIRLLLLAEQSQYVAQETTLARASGTASLLLLEGAAATCLDSLSLGGAIADDLDRLPVLSKFDVYVRLRFRGRTLDRGSAPVQLFPELKQLRDNYAHAKSRRVVLKRESPIETSAETERTPQLKVPRTFHDWAPADAEAVMRGVHTFLGHVMRDICRFGPTQASALLFSCEQVPNVSTAMVPYFEDELLNAAKRWRVDLAYLRLARS